MGSVSGIQDRKDSDLSLQWNECGRHDLWSLELLGGTQGHHIDSCDHKSVKSFILKLKVEAQSHGTSFWPLRSPLCKNISHLCCSVVGYHSQFTLCGEVKKFLRSKLAKKFLNPVSGFPGTPCSP